MRCIMPNALFKKGYDFGFQIKKTFDIMSCKSKVTLTCISMLLI